LLVNHAGSPFRLGFSVQHGRRLRRPVDGAFIERARLRLLGRRGILRSAVLILSKGGRHKCTGERGRASDYERFPHE
jgi:hypothetical protein